MIKGCDAEAACRELSEYYDIIRHESGSGIAGTTIELVPKGLTRQWGSRQCADSLIFRGRIPLCLGDSNNDLAMFEYAAVKVAMGNGSEKIKLWLIILHRICSLWNQKRTGISEADINIKAWAQISPRLCIYRARLSW